MKLQYNNGKRTPSDSRQPIIFCNNKGTNTTMYGHFFPKIRLFVTYILTYFWVLTLTTNLCINLHKFTRCFIIIMCRKHVEMCTKQ